MTRRQGHVRHARHRPTGAVGRVLGVTAAAALGFVLVMVQTVAAQFSGAVDQRDASPLVTVTPDAPADAQQTRPLNILLIGSDTRSGDNAEVTGDVAPGMRSDATVLAHISGDRERIDLMSIPRDLQVVVPDCTLFDGTTVPGWHGDFTIAFSNGGREGDPAEAAACTINTVHEITDIRIDHWAVVDFTGFSRMVDALGGVPMCIPERIVSERANLDLQPGPQVLTGAEALGWARLRTAEVGDVSGSDLQRINRQQDLLERTLQAALAKNLLTDVGELTSFLRAVAESLTTDETLGDLNFMVGLATSLRGLTSDDLTATTVPWEYTEDRLDVVMTEDAARMFDDIRHDRPLSVRPEGDSTSEWDAGPSAPPGGPAGSPGPAPSEAPSAGPDTIDDILAACET